jgi:GNAT superfamily N-acetyltransferase
MALAVLAGPGTWWRDQVAEAVLEHAERWLGERCLEIVHVAVTPAAQGRGVGRLVHDVLIAGSPAPTAVLSCHPEAVPAQRLYLSRHWTVLTKSFQLGGNVPHWLMARDL